MSSNGPQHSPESLRLRALGVSLPLAALGMAAPVAAQDDSAITNEDAADQEASGERVPIEGVQPPRLPRDRINLSITVPRDESDRLIEQDCEEEADAARIANEIIVCRQLGEATDGSWDKGEWERDYARRTQGGSTPDVAGGGIFRGEATVGGLCLIPPCPPEAALMIDVEALPEAPPGSDADRIARGLPPLGQDDLTPEEIAERRRALGLEAPPVPE